MRTTIIAAALSIGLIPVAKGADAPAAPPPPSDLAQQVQAAELLSDVITYSTDRGEARLSAMKQFLDEAGKSQAFAAQRSSEPRPRKLDYVQLFRGALLVVKDGKDGDVDPGLKSASDADLYEMLTRSQYYNMHQFLRFNQQRDSFDAMTDFMKSNGLIDAFDKSQNAPAEAAASQPAPTAATSIAERIEKVMDEMKESAWEKAKSQGKSRSEFDSQWPQQLADYRGAVEGQVEGFQSRAGSLGKAEAAGTPQPPDQANAPQQQPMNGGPIGGQPSIVAPVAVAPTPNGSAAPPTPPVISPTVQSPYGNQMYRARDDSLWNMWDYNLGYEGGGRRR